MSRLSHHYKQVSVRPCEHRDVHRHVDGVGLVQAHTKVSLPAQQQQNEHADVHESNAGCIRGKHHQNMCTCDAEACGYCEETEDMRLTLVSPGIIQVEEYRNQNIQHIAALQDEKQEFLQWKNKGVCVE